MPDFEQQISVPTTASDIKTSTERTKSDYGKIKQLGDWVLGDLNLHHEGVSRGAMDDVNVVVNRVADCLPI
jgi:hypothetical protein